MKTPDELAKEVIHKTFKISKTQWTDCHTAFLLGFDVAETRRWIPVTESLPEVKENVLLFAPQKQEQIGVGSRYDVDKTYRWSVQHVTYVDEDVTHWMRLPSLP